MFTPGEDENEDAEIWQPGPDVSRGLFLEWRDARRGTTPGETMSNPVWLWLIDSNISAYRGNKHFDGPSSYNGNPGWCFNRFGRTLTELPGGTQILIAGEHEDHYDPDFFIYNDVVIAHPGGRIEILGYPEDHFPPTDFHSATLIGNELILIGNLSYREQRRIGETQVYAFDFETRRFRRVATTGDCPGWISRHMARLDERNGIVIEGGRIDHGPEGGGYLENFDAWRLNLDDWSWERLTYQVIHRWKFVREDGEACRLFPKRLGSETVDKILLARLYDPPVPHDVVMENDWSDRTRYVIDGVPLHFSEEMHWVQLTVEGELPPELTDAYVKEVTQRLTELEGSAYFVSKQ